MDQFSSCMHSYVECDIGIVILSVCLSHFGTVSRHQKVRISLKLFIISSQLHGSSLLRTKMLSCN